MPVTGAVIVTTPQDIALIDARKGLKMFEKVGVPILGIVENMSTPLCSQLRARGADLRRRRRRADGQDYGVALLGSLPLDIKIREQADSGRRRWSPIRTAGSRDIYREIARQVAVKIAEKQQDYSAAFPKIVVQNT